MFGRRPILDGYGDRTPTSPLRHAKDSWTVCVRTWDGHRTGPIELISDAPLPNR
jgi:hypothetical protein